MSGDLIVRDARDSDAADIALLLGQLGYTRTPEGVAEDLSRRMRGAVLVAVAEAMAIGVLAMSYHYQLHRGGDVAAVDALVVDARVRSRGAGRALLTDAMDRARRAGCLRVELHSNLSRTDAHRFYEREGFVSTSRFFVRPL